MASRSSCPIRGRRTRPPATSRAPRRTGGGWSFRRAFGRWAPGCPWISAGRRPSSRRRCPEAPCAGTPSPRSWPRRYARRPRSSSTASARARCGRRPTGSTSRITSRTVPTRSGSTSTPPPSTGRPEPGSASLYFHQNAYTAEGDKLLISTPGGLATVDLRTRRLEPVVSGRVSQVVVGPKTRQVFYMKDGTVYATHLDTKATRAIVTRPELRSGSGLTLNADETLLAGSYVERGAGARPSPEAPDPLA